MDDAYDLLNILKIYLNRSDLWLKVKGQTKVKIKNAPIELKFVTDDAYDHLNILKILLNRRDPWLGVEGQIKVKFQTCSNCIEICQG